MWKYYLGKSISPGTHPSQINGDQQCSFLSIQCKRKLKETSRYKWVLKTIYSVFYQMRPVQVNMGARNESCMRSAQLCPCFPNANSLLCILKDNLRYIQLYIQGMNLGKKQYYQHSGSFFLSCRKMHRLSQAAQPQKYCYGKIVSKTAQILWERTNLIVLWHFVTSQCKPAHKIQTITSVCKY